MPYDASSGAQEAGRIAVFEREVRSKVSNGFESAEHRSTFVAQARAGRVSLKYAYSGSAAVTHNALAEESSYHSVVGEAELERSCLLAAGVLVRDVCELGPGNGVHSSALLRALAPSVERYLALDFSADLLEICRSRIEAAAPSAEVRCATWDVESGPTVAIDRWRSGQTVCWFIGHTIGNLHDPVTALRNIEASLRPGDVLLVSAALRANGGEDLLDPYRNPVFTAAALEPFRMLGIAVPDSAFELDVDHEGTITGRVNLELCENIPSDLSGAPSAIECFRSRRFDSEDLIALLRHGGFEALSKPVIADDGGNIALALSACGRASQ